MFRRLVFLRYISILIVAISALHENNAVAISYQVTDLGIISGTSSSEAFGINDYGAVTGGSDNRPFLWTAKTGMQDLGFPSGYYSASGTAINNNGQIAIRADKMISNFYYGHAFRWSSNGYQDMGTLGGTFSTCYGIDDAGRIAGYAYTAGGDIHAYRSTTGTSLVDIDSLGGDYSLGYGINAIGQVVGQAYTAAHKYHAFLWNASGSMQDLETLGGTQSQANDISDSGIIVGDSSTANDRSYHAFILQNGVMRDLGSLTSYSSYGVAVNNAGQVIGSYSDGEYAHPYIWDNVNGMKDLNGLLDPILGAGWTLYTVNNINNQGQIVGQGRHNGNVRAFLLTPIPEPDSIVILICGAIAFLCYARFPRIFLNLAADSVV